MHPASNLQAIKMNGTCRRLGKPWNHLPTCHDELTRVDQVFNALDGITPDPCLITPQCWADHANSRALSLVVSPVPHTFHHRYPRFYKLDPIQQNSRRLVILIQAKAEMDSSNLEIKRR